MKRNQALKVVIFLSLLLTAISLRAAAQFESDEEVIVTDLAVAGNFEVSDEEILSVVSTKVNEPLSTEKLEEDLQSIFDLGYFSQEIKASLSEYEGGARVTFRVQENPVVNDIIFEGNTAFGDSKLLDTMSTKKNEVLNSATLRLDVETIETMYYDEGYLAARVIDVPMDTDHNLHVQISEGIIQDIRVEYVITEDDSPDAVEILDSGKTKPYVVTREMKTKVGDVYNTNKIGKDLQRIYNLGFFEDVHTKVETGDRPGNIILVIEVEETNTGSVGFGAGYSSNSGITGFLSLSERNLQGKGRRGDIKLQFGGKRDNYELGYFEPWLDNKQTSVEVGIYNSSEQDFRYGLGGTVTSDYEEIRRGFTLTVGRPITDFTKVFIGLKAENVNVQPSIYDWLDGSSRSVTGTIRTDTRDNIFNPTTGRYDSGSLEMNGGVLGGDFNYEKLIVDLRRFRPVREKQVFGVRMKMGLGRRTIPQFDWFDIGGVNSLRGYDEYQFSGTKMILYNAEYRFNFSGNLSAVLFADAGNTWMDFNEVTPNPREYAKSVGVGLRLKIPAFGIGPVRLDYAYATTIQESKIHFGFGHMF